MADHTNDDELQDPQNWDFESAKVVKPTGPTGAVVSVRFAKDDLSLVSNAAAHSKMKTSEFIRNAAIEKAAMESRKPVVSVSPATGSNVHTAESANWRRTFGSGRVRIIEEIIGGVAVIRTS